MLFRELLDTLGIDMDRIHFTWISAAEGKKFQQVDHRDHRKDARSWARTRPIAKICEAS